MHKKSKHHNTLLTVGWIVAAAAVIFVVWQRYQFPHEAFPVREDSLAESIQKRPQPSMPVTDAAPSQQ